jgi:uncharacterized hydrophobic protein (TIGR00271 family)
MARNLPLEETPSSSFLQHLTGDWHPLIEKPVLEHELLVTMHKSALPVLGFYLMLFFAGAIATLGLLANSAPTIIGAMIIAPLMSPIISLSFGIVVVDWQLINRSLFMLVTGIVLVVALAFVTTEYLGLNIAGAEILGRSHPTLLDLGVAIAAGGAAAFAYTRHSIMNAIAGVAIAVALVPPLAVCGIGLSQGLSASADAGYAASEIGHYSGGASVAEGAALLFLTNLAGIVVTAGAVFAAHGYGHTTKALLGLLAVAVASFGLLHPLGVSLYKLHVKSSVMSLIMSNRRELPKFYDENARVEAVSVRFNGDVVKVNINVLESETQADKMQQKVQAFQSSLSQLLKRPVVVDVDLIAVPVLHFSAGGNAVSPSTKISDVAAPHDLDQDAAAKDKLTGAPVIQEEGK